MQTVESTNLRRPECRRFHLKSRFWALLLLGLLVVFGLRLRFQPNPEAVAVTSQASAQIGRATRRAGLTLVRGTTVYALAGAPQHPQSVLFDAVASHHISHLYKAQVDWTSSATPQLQTFRDLTPKAGLTVVDPVVQGDRIYMLAALDTQVQAVNILNLSTGRVSVFSLVPPASAALWTLKPQGAVELNFRPLGSKSSTWEHATIWPNQHGYRVSSAALQRVRSGRSNQSLFIDVVEAVRRHLGAPVVAMIENVWYGAKDQVIRWAYRIEGGPHNPSVSATAESGVPLAVFHHRSRITTPSSTPAALTIPATWPHAAGEGVWQPVGPLSGGQPVMERTFVLPDPARPYAVVDLVWMNTHDLDFHLVAGTQDPVSVTGIRGPGEIPASPNVRSRVVAAFNAGFKTISGHYGVMVDHEIYLPPIPGIATLGLYQDHSVRLGAWGTDLGWSPSLVSFRQNLPLLIAQHKTNPHIEDMRYWGVTVKNAIHVWRSALAITPRGNLIYAAGPDLSSQSLAASLQVAGVVNAMELDINSYWVTFNLYHWVGASSGSGSLVGTKLMPPMTRLADRYLSPDTRDFFYVTLARHPRVP